MRRRDFIAGLGSAAAAAVPVGAQAQRGSVPIIGWLHAQTPEAQHTFMPAFHQGLAEIGFVEGRNVAMEHLWDEGHYDRRPALAADLVRRQVSVIVTDTTFMTAVAKAATRTIPIVFAMAGGNPVEFGIVESLNRPGGNVTGVAMLGIDVTSKRLQLTSQLVPSARLIAAFVGPEDRPFTETETRDLQSAARVLGIPMLILNVGTESDIVAAFETLTAQKAGALLLSVNVFLQRARKQIIALAEHHVMPTMFWDDVAVAAGGVASYGPDFASGYHQAGLYVGRILKGEKPADLPVVQPTKFEFMINLKTAKAFGLTIPETLLATADEVIQ
jgi:putative tryptophan/tyrosine transport system substrate-binding protein